MKYKIISSIIFLLENKIVQAIIQFAGISILIISLHPTAFWQFFVIILVYVIHNLVSYISGNTDGEKREERIHKKFWNCRRKSLKEIHEDLHA